MCISLANFFFLNFLQERYKHYITQIKEIADRDKAPTLDKGAASRFVRNALWTPKDSEAQSKFIYFYFHKFFII